MNVIGLTEDWHWIGIGLGVDWQIGTESILAQYWLQIAIGLAPDWHQIGTRLAMH